jgi:hypothetical protein
MKKILTNPWLLLIATLCVCAGISLTPWGPKNRSAQDVAVVFAVPIILFDTIVGYAFTWLLYFLTPRQSRQSALPLNAYSKRVKWIVAVVLWYLLFCVICLLAAVSLLIACLLYRPLGVPWAIREARHLSYWLGGLAIALLLPAASFVAGIQVNKRVVATFSLASEEIYAASRLFRRMKSA